VQKAKLDILENLPDIEIADAPIEPGEASAAEFPVSKEKWAISKLLLIGAPLLIVFLLISGVLWFYLGKKVITPHKPPVAALEQKAGKKEAAGNVSSLIVSSESIKVNKVYFNDFIIDLKDKAGKSKILMCDVVLDVNEEKNIARLERGQNVRNLIYQTAKGKNAVALRSLEERKRLKKEIAVELNKIFGEDIVKNVYFTSFLII
jgi:flagellar basal body-associated protein FliL